MEEYEKIAKYEQRLNRTREFVDTEPRFATEYIIELEDEIEKFIQQLNN